MPYDSVLERSCSHVWPGYVTSAWDMMMKNRNALESMNYIMQTFFES